MSFLHKLLSSVCIGSDTLFQLSQGTYIITFNNLLWLDFASIRDAVGEIVLVSACKGIIKLRVGHTVEALKSTFAQVNAAHPGCIRQLLSNCSDKIWSSIVADSWVKSQQATARSPDLS